jgi:hypothetical protein
LLLRGQIRRDRGTDRERFFFAVWHRRLDVCSYLDSCGSLPEKYTGLG